MATVKRRSLIRHIASASAFFGCSGCKNNVFFEAFPEGSSSEKKSQSPGALSLKQEKDLLFPLDEDPQVQIPTFDPEKSRTFDQYHREDIIVTDKNRKSLFYSTYKKLGQVQKFVGFGHFNVIDFEETIRISKRSSRLAAFTPQEISLIDELFHYDARQYGFFGHKVSTSLTARIDSKSISKIPGSGHYLLLGPSHDKYQKIRAEIGNKIILTSGIRGVIKQTYLFLNKAVHADWNLSLASRSLAPPGYSWHNAGDFDIGKQGFGMDNFTSRFSNTDEYKKLVDMGIAIRYPEGNTTGVRFEPWHIRMES
ncbi:MAG: D-alanyl-D-alanine carboxypeptidase family protein [Oligoflexales bacterium]